jgi:hypothetical protein
VEEESGAPEGYDHATPAHIGQAIECGECGRTIPSGEWLWLLSQGEIEAAAEVKVLCSGCGDAAGCGNPEEPDTNGA